MAPTLDQMLALFCTGYSSLCGHVCLYVFIFSSIALDHMHSTSTPGEIIFLYVLLCVQYHISSCSQLLCR